MKTARRITAVGALLAGLAVVSACGSSSETSTSQSSTTSAAGVSAASVPTTDVPAKKAQSDVLKKWQTDLDKVGCSAGPIDGIETGETEAAIRAFQAQSKLGVDGKIGPKTEAALSKAAAAGKKVCATTPGTAGPGTTAARSATTQTPAPAPTPSGDANLGIYPGSGPARTTVIISSAGSACTGEVRYLGPDDKELASAGNMVAAGADQYTLTFTIPPGDPGQYRFKAVSCGALAYFSLT